MEKVSINSIKPGNSFSEDSYILEDLFFIPKNLPIEDYHIRSLRKWGIEDIYTNGRITTIGMNKLVVPNENLKDTLNKLVDNEKIVNINKTTITEKKEELDKSIDNSKDDSNIGLLDDSVKTLYEKFRKWIINAVNIFNEILTKTSIDKDKVANFVVDIITTVNKNKNNALMLFDKTIEGVLYIFPQTIKTIILAYIIGDSLKYSQLAISNLATSTLFHDIGMLKIPRSLLDKTTSLTEEEKGIIHKHTLFGYKYLRDMKYSAIIASGALQHHERMDGKGYPNGLFPDRITEIAKIIAVVDAYCAAIASKPFRKSPAHAKEVIQDLLRSGGTAYEPIILKELIKNISFYPIGSLILLSNNLPARVVGTSGVAMRPIVRTIVKDEDGEVINLSKNNNVYIKGVYSTQE